MKRWLPALSPLFLLAALVACGTHGTESSSNVTIVVSVPQRSPSPERGATAPAAPSLPVDNICFSITGPGMAEIEREVAVPPGRVVSESFAVPNGPARRFVVRAYDNLGMMTYRGESRADLSGAPVRLSIAVELPWRPTLVGAPAARHDHGAVWTGTEMIVWGGRGAGGPLSDGGRYDPAADVWRPTSTVNAPAGRGHFAAFWTGTKMIAWGGGPNPRTPGSLPIGDFPAYNDGGLYDPATDSWDNIDAVNAPPARDGFSAVWTGSRMIVCGGVDVSGPATTGSSYDPAANRWDNTAAAPFTVTGQTAVWTGSRLIVAFAGANYAALYNPVSDNWTVAAPTTPAFNIAAKSIWTGTKMIVWGGTGPDALGKMYDPAGDNWVTLTAAPSVYPRIEPSVVWTGSRMIAWGGQDNTGLTGSVILYDPVSRSWSGGSAAGAPDRRYGHSAVWTGSEMVVWGGIETDVKSDGGRYDPVLDRWRPTGQAAPSARRLATAVWTGSSMVVWGGYDAAGSPLGTGKRYDPVADLWTPVSDNGAPAPRGGHTAVWTGTRMVIWGGGLYGSAWLDTGGRYDPATDSWQATATAGAPSPRLNHAAVWAGDGVNRMVVWGGDADGEAGDGGRYDPVADSWAATSQAGAPSARHRHSGVWTGSRMIVWGGNGSVYSTPVPRGDGAAYDPVGNSWTALPAPGAPPARYNHRAVWSGKEMIVWGGDNAGAPLGSGGRYDPAAGSWAPVSTALAPSARTGHAAAWTDYGMAVWGGSDNYDGAIYDPVDDSWEPMSWYGSPAARQGHVMVWTGRELIVWGGVIANGRCYDTGGRYAP